jgi:nitrile hydratase
MDGIHDLGGKQGFGPINAQPYGKAFSEHWEAAVFSMLRAAQACGAVTNTDQFRYAVERIDPIAYLTHGYYGRWLGALENMLVEAGTITTEELSARAVALGGDPAARVAARPDSRFHPPPPPSGEGARRPLARAPRFRVGQRVLTSAETTSGHTRLPAYARNRRGVITAHHDGWVFPDTNAMGDGEAPTHLYTVAFDGLELWGPESEPGVVVHLDLFEPYLKEEPTT